MSDEEAETEPDMLRFWVKVEEAEATSPPEELSKKMVEEAESVIRNGEPVCPARVFKVKRFDGLDVAEIVKIDLTSGLAIPMLTKSVNAV